MDVELLFPNKGVTDLETVLKTVANCRTARPFDESMLAACADLSRRIMQDAEARRYPELLALAFWIRKAELIRLREEFASLDRSDRILVPSGTVFHLPPRNVDTMFVYSWLLSALVGNKSIIRLSPLRTDSTNLLLRLFRDALAAAEEPARSSTLIVSYGHESAITAALTACSDLRVIWGGDNTVNEVRRAPLPPHGREVIFPDRYSMAAVKIGSYLALSTEDRDRLADLFFNDVFWFDQMACSSPQLVVWCGDRVDARLASTDFFTRVCACARRRGYLTSAANSMQKLTFAAGAILDMFVESWQRFPELTILSLASLNDLNRSHPGGGLVFEVTMNSLAELVPSLVRKDQTLTTFGFDDTELISLIEQLNGKAIDRIVPIGQALQFGRFWDGYDLLRAFCREVYVNNSTIKTMA